MQKYACWDPESSEIEDPCGPEQGEPLGSRTAEGGCSVEPQVVRRGSSVTHTPVLVPSALTQSSLFLLPSVLHGLNSLTSFSFHFQALIAAFGCFFAFLSSWTVVTLLTHLCYKTDLPLLFTPDNWCFQSLPVPTCAIPMCSMHSSHFVTPALTYKAEMGHVQCCLLIKNLQIGWDNEILISLIKNNFSIHYRTFPLLS